MLDDAEQRSLKNGEPFSVAASSVILARKVF
jgi:hypothetical protein